ncbi:Auxin responsive SAUR protein [Artemisia annua]|uniref:Auxin responsive SAUR protein n=1 Tax=Artemisia annua TaxID=35608 RepID=A0A2U1QBP3_ARTAN|nr:Auxin responsive SAUR protein [Artemisia annua]
MKKKINIMLRKCKSLSKQLTLPSSYITSGSKSARHNQVGTGGIIWNTNAISVYKSSDVSDITYVTRDNEEPKEQVFVGSMRKRYVISSKYLSHPLVNALVSKSSGGDSNDENDVSVINCEVVLFDHLLWMLENAEFNVGSDCFDELADLYSS